MAMGKPPKMKIITKPKDLKKAWKNLLGYNKKYITGIVLALIFALASSVLILLGPDKLRDITNEIQMGLMGTINLDKIGKIAFTLLAFYVGGFALNLFQNLIMNRITQGVCSGLRTDISKKINKLPMSFFAKTKTGDILSVVTNDVDTIGQSFNQSIGTLVTAVTLLVGSTIMMFKTNWIMSLTAIFSSLFGFFLIGFIMKKSQKHFVAQQKNLGLINGHIEEIYSGQKVIKAYNGEQNAKSEFTKLNNNLANSNYKAQCMSGLMMPLMGFIGNLGYVAVCIVGALLTKKNIIDFGVIIAFTMYVRYFTQPLSQIAQAMQNIQSAGAAGERVFEFLEQKEMKDESNMPDKNISVHGDVEFKNVRFAYDKRIIIHDFSAKAKSGQKIALVGPTGAGKTTMVNLLMRFYELNQPRLIVGGELTNYQVFNNGKSLEMLIDEQNNLYLDGQKTNFVIDDKVAQNLQVNKAIKFDQHFNLLIDDKPLDYKIQIITGDSIDNDHTAKLAVAYYGDIFIDGIPTKSLRRDEVHDMFCMVLQDTWLFNGTIKQNLVYNAQDVKDEQIIEACKAVGIHHFIKTLAKGYDTVLGDMVSLSAGQKQQLTIARAMIANRPMLILDEATSSVDTRTELMIQNAMDKLMHNKTSFVIAHRLSTIKNADLILVLKDGDIIESGDHNTLLNQNGFYASLYNSQFSEN